MAILKTLLTFMLAGAFLGLAAASWLGRKWLEYDNSTSLVPTQTMCNLPEVIHNVTTKLFSYQINGTLAGAAIFLALGITFVVARSRRQARQTPPPQPGPAA